MIGGASTTSHTTGKEWNPYAPVTNQRRREATRLFIAAIRNELRARNAFKEEPTHENLTLWANARHTLEERKEQL